MAGLTHLLDTSAWLAHVFEEPGSQSVTELFDRQSVAVSVLSLAEMGSRLEALGRAAEFDALWTAYRDLVDAVVPVSEEVALCANRIRNRTTGRLPVVDALIAASASVHKLILVHRDPHFLGVPGDLLGQLPLGMNE